MNTPAFIALIFGALSATQAWGADCSVPGLENAQGYLRYDILAPAMPPTRTVLSFDAPRGRHVEVVWDPLQSNRLDRLVILDRSTDWTVSLSAEPLRDPGQGKHDYAWQFTPGTCVSQKDDKGKFKLNLRVQRLTPQCLRDGGAGGDCNALAVESLDITITEEREKPTASEVTRSLVRREGGRPSDAAVSSQGRSLLGGGPIRS